MKRIRISRAAIAALTLISCNRVQQPPTTQLKLGGDYGPVEKHQLIGEQNCTATGTSGAQFSWHFSADGFEIQENGGPIPQEVLDTILGKDAKAQVIEGKWELVGRALKLTNIQADKKGGFKDVELKPFRTPVVRFYFGETQYVLGPKRKG